MICWPVIGRNLPCRCGLMSTAYSIASPTFSVVRNETALLSALQRTIFLPARVGVEDQPAPVPMCSRYGALEVRRRRRSSRSRSSSSGSDGAVGASVGLAASSRYWSP